MTKCFKKSKKANFVGPICPNVSKNKFSWKKQFLDVPIIYHYAKIQKKTNEPYLKKS